MLFSKGFLIVVLIIVLLYAILVMTMYAQQERFIFYPVVTDSEYKYLQFPSAEELYLKAPDRVQLHSLFFKVPDSKGVVLYFHGNAGAIDSWGYNAADFQKYGYDVLMPDYRSYGKSGGKLAYHHFDDDALLFYDYLTEKYDTAQIILYGRSLGSGIASELATKVQVQQLILETPYTSIVDMAKISMSFLPVKLLLRYPFSNERNLTKVKCPFHMLHGTRDELIPYSQAVRLAGLFPGKNVLTTIPNGGHNNLSEFPLFHEKISSLLK